MNQKGISRDIASPEFSTAHSIKSAIFKALEAIKATNVSLVPNHLKNNASNYLNPHNYQGNWLQQEYLPTDLQGMKFWKPKDSGWEKNKYEDIRNKRKSQNIFELQIILGIKYEVSLEATEIVHLYKLNCLNCNFSFFFL